MTQHADVIGSSGAGMVNRIGGAIDFASQLMATNPLYARANPLVSEKLDRLKGQDRNYLAHEYFNRDWHPMHFSQMADWLEPAKLQYACSANYLDHVDAINFTAEQQTFLQSIPDRMFRESVRDFIVNQQFRKDYWVKGLRTLSPLKRIELLGQERFILLSHASDINFKINTGVGEVTLAEQIYKPIIDILADYKIHSIGQLEIALKDKNIVLGQIVQAMVVLGGLNIVASVRDEASISKSRKNCDALNLHLINAARDSMDVSYLASPVIGGGIAIGRFAQLFVGALKRGGKSPNDLAGVVWSILSAQGQKIIKEGKTLETSQENLKELTAQAQVFIDKQLPILKALQIV
jgi:hypothetical protein